MVNFWYDETCIGEIQLVYKDFKGKSEADIQKIKDEIDFNHFCYEVERNSMGAIFHCVDMLIMQEQQKK